VLFRTNADCFAVSHACEFAVIERKSKRISRFQQELIDDLKPYGACQLDVVERLAATFWRLRRIPRFEAAILAWLEHEDFHSDNKRSPGMFHYDLRLPGEEASSTEEMLDKHTAARWLGRDPYQLKVLGRMLEDALTRDGPLLKLNTYEARLIRQSQQLMGQFFALRKARAAELSLDEMPGTSAMDPDNEEERLTPGGAVGEDGEGHSRH
jgi:hypothetical protein